jgi:peptidylprolyl isomerase
MSTAKKGNIVKVHYTGMLESGEIIDTSQDEDPLQFTIGKGEVISGLEEAVIGMEEGESKKTKISSEKAYGSHRKEMVATVEKEKFPQHIQPEVGQRLKVVQPNGTATRVTVTEVSGSKVTLDANHPLAGKNLIFNITLLEVV